MSTAIVGGPLTVTFLVLESTGNLGIAGGVLAASIATTLAVRATFGYSFTTWRLHLRGETIRGGQDVGWLRELTVAKMMVPAPPVFPAEESLRAFREAHPLGSANVVVAVGEDGRYHGLVLVPEAHAHALEEGDDGGPVGLIARLPATTLHPDDDVRSALDLFGAAHADTLAVTSRETGQVLGLLGEAFAARRYAQETDGAMRGRARRRVDALERNRHLRRRPSSRFPCYRPTKQSERTVFASSTKSENIRNINDLCANRRVLQVQITRIFSSFGNRIKTEFIPQISEEYSPDQGIGQHSRSSSVAGSVSSASPQPPPPQHGFG